MDSTSIRKPAVTAAYSGILQKWTNYWSGYKKRYFVLQNGVLSYFRNQAEMTHTCRGTIGLLNSTITVMDDAVSFVITSGGTNTFHLKASSEPERQRWITQLELAKDKAIRIAEEDEDDVVEYNNNEVQNTLRELNAKLEDLKTCNEFIDNHWNPMRQLLADLEKADKMKQSELADKYRQLNQRSALFKVTVAAMIQACTDYLSLAQTQGHKWQRIIQHEHEQKVRMEELLEQLAKQHSDFEKEAKELRRSRGSKHHLAPDAPPLPPSAPDHGLPSAASAAAAAALRDHLDISSADDDNDQFEDAMDEFEVSLPLAGEPRRSDSAHSFPDDESSDGDDSRAGDRASVGDRASNGSRGRNRDAQQPADGSCHSRDDLSQSTASSSSTGASKLAKAAATRRVKVLRGADSKVVDRTAPLNGAVGRIEGSQRRRRRRTIPPKPAVSFALWSVLKNSIGKDLTKIPVPVEYCEPISFLQRLSEELENSACLDQAAQCSDAHLQMCYVAAFIVSGYASTVVRTGKPFNPLLGETFEFDRRDDYGWRVILEQVSHHPPTAAMHAEGRNWLYWHEFTLQSKFRGTNIAATPIGVAHLWMPELSVAHKFNTDEKAGKVTEKTVSISSAIKGNHYTWNRVTTSAHNIVIGTLWLDNHGLMDITNHSTGDKCRLQFDKYNYLSSGRMRRVTGLVTDKHDTPKWALSGFWDERMEASRVENFKSSGKKDKNFEKVCETSERVVLWERPSVVTSPKLYHFSPFTMELNEPEDGLAPTDSRLRPDIRIMEEGRFDEANKEKARLEDKQRAVRRLREARLEESASNGKPFSAYTPRWFHKDACHLTDTYQYVYSGQYWTTKARQPQLWPACPDIYSDRPATIDYN